MNFKNNFYSVENVNSGHPDKICDQISDAILDECLRQDSSSRVAVETFASNGLIVIGGEISSQAVCSAESIVRKVYKDIGYSESDDLSIIVNINQQSSDISRGVDKGGAGDQGIMYGYANSETEAFLPAGIVLARNLVQGLDKLRQSQEITWLQPDGKAQVTFNKDYLSSLVLSCQHQESVNLNEMRQELIEKLIEPLNIDLQNTNIYINPGGKFIIGGLKADTGLTGRKIMVDTYGGLTPHGGGCFSGKDATKVDRSGAYMARYVAKNIVANHLAKSCLVSVAYAIGKEEPLMVEAINEKGTRIPPPSATFTSSIKDVFLLFIY